MNADFSPDRAFDRDLQFLLDAGASRMGHARSRFTLAFGAAFAWHAGLFGLIAFSLMRPSVPAQLPAFASERRAHESIVWLSNAGRGGGGGGGPTPQPSRRAEAPGLDRVTVPVVRPLAFDAMPPPVDAPLPAQQLAIEAVPLARGVESLVGVIEPAPDADSASRGPGDGSGAGKSVGPGVGDGRGGGLDDGRDRGTGGDGPYQIGNGVASPRVIWIEKPRYTVDAMQRRLQGSVFVECVVELNGRCNQAHVIRSLDPTFGLDQAAVRAAELWRFQPGTRFGQPVPVLVRIELEFTIR